MNTRHIESVGLTTLLVIGTISAIGGGIGLLGGGITFPLDWLDGSPFASYTIPGIILAIVVGGSQLLGAIAVGRDIEWSRAATAFAGTIMMGWIASEVLIVGSNGVLMFSLQAIYFSVGMIELALAARGPETRASRT